LPSGKLVQLDRAAVVATTVAAAGGIVIRVATRTRTAGPATSVEWGESHGVESQGIDGFFGSALEPLLRRLGIERLVLVGSWLETSVHSTMRTANDMGFECLLVVDACVAGDQALVSPSVSMIEMSGGIFGAVGHTVDVIAAFAPQ
jgi:hypothetical protein